MKIFYINWLLSQTKYVNFVPRSEIQKQEARTETVVTPAYQRFRPSLHLFPNKGLHWNVHVPTGNKTYFCCICLHFIPLFRLACCVDRWKMWKNPSRTLLESMNNSCRNSRRRWVAKREVWFLVPTWWQVKYFASLFLFLCCGFKIPHF